jgi:hypothetical protein
MHRVAQSAALISKRLIARHKPDRNKPSGKRDNNQCAWRWLVTISWSTKEARQESARRQAVDGPVSQVLSLRASKSRSAALMV